MATRKRTATKAKTLVIDAGNGNVKVNLAGESELIPSLLSNNNGAYIRGGFSLGDESWILGWDNYNRPDKKAVADSSTGKLDYLHLMLAGSLSAMSHLLTPGDKLDLHLLTLNSDKRNTLEQAVEKATADLSIDGEPMKLQAHLARVYPEGVGASLYAASVFPCVPRVSVLDFGNGTLNLAQYFIGNPSKPRRENFSFVPCGVQKLVALTSDLLTQETTNGSVDENLVRQALDTNSYRYLDSYQGRDIWTTCAKATEAWLELSKVKLLLTQAVRSLASGIPVVCVGGGFSLHIVQQMVTEALASQGSRELIHIPSNPLTVGVDGLYEVLQP
ncbi:ParM/StbA family protein [Fortiea contorta]|uniref:ParM/StbA family protein n=1 Tax=Fortiea contorta TaxID=1892405 RepID=UPI0003464A6F|nr:hypothetical protein [Fortiea contorta]